MAPAAAPASPIRLLKGEFSYLSDTVIVLGCYETEGGVRRCLAIAKKKHCGCDTTIREFTLAPGSVRVGEQPLSQFRNILVPNPLPAEKAIVNVTDSRKTMVSPRKCRHRAASHRRAAAW